MLVSLALPHDRAAVYALAGGVFHVVSNLTAVREALRDQMALTPGD